MTPLAPASPPHPTRGAAVRHRRRDARRITAIALATAASLLLAGCAADGADAGPVAASASSGPVSVDSCDRTLSFPTGPQRIVSLWPAVTEMLLQLGAGDRLVGQAFTDQSPPLDAYRDAFDRVPVLGTGAVDRETLLAAHPDLIVADGEYHFDGTELPTIDDLAALGIRVYVISSFCHGQVTTGHVDDAADDLTALGTLLGAERAAADAVADQRARLAAVDERVRGTEPIDLAVLQVFDGAVYADARGLYSDVVARAGGRDVYEDALPADQYYAEVSVEDVARRDPGTIVYLYSTDAERDSVRADLEARLPGVAAVREGRMLALPSTDFIGSRAVDGVVALEALLHG
ncbi:ABC transporter substrate-binding protein [Clavibacter michiganensis]|uniref:ABC transporter substrate-binding protein n=1 Tax=Clavibacter michiganensis TaxID=28447 RepID=A0A2S5VU44_9MICO|nr:ABC transporter substrate-binding protein [Clavibacter michiganensis]PPF67816.1 ABC transporter substrate-binding protein [Clavibacter michiganensis]